MLCREFGEKYAKFRTVVQNLAVLDCLASLAEVAKHPGYVKPAISDKNEVCH